jgi:hypothetical protein
MLVRREDCPFYADFGISRVTDHKIIKRYSDSGLEAFTDRSRKPFRPADLYTQLIRKYDGPPDVTYPFHGNNVTITQCECICMTAQRIQ